MSPDDVGTIPKGMAHYVQNPGDEPLRYLEMFRSRVSWTFRSTNGWH